MKKVLAMILCLVMAGSLVVGCGEETTEPEEEGGLSFEEEVVEEVVAEEAPEAKYYFSFEDATGLTPVWQVAKAEDSINDGATYDIAEVEADVLFSNGPVGQCLYANGQYGYKLDIEALDTDEYTISFWLNADRLSTYGPTLQVGRNMGRADTSDATVTWLNFTKTEWGTASADIFPVIWNRNSEVGVWPWVYATDDAVHGKREWIMVTLVCSGERYTQAEDGLDRIGAKMYLDGALAFDASADLNLYGGISPEVLTGDGVEGYLGVNYWDTIYKGYFDELYIFDCALTDGQVLGLFEQGDKNVESVAPEYEEIVSEEVPEAVVITPVADIAVDEAALEVLGTTDFALGWWSNFTNGVEIKDGETKTVKLNNYSDGANNWDNYVVGFANTATTSDLIPSADNYPGYAEWAIVRADSYGWAPAGATYVPTFENSWTDWAAWLALMTDAEVTIEITRSGADILMKTTFVGADGTEMICNATITTDLTAESPCFFFFTGEKCYVEILSVE